jgi:hypothetical protein
MQNKLDRGVIPTLLWESPVLQQLLEKAMTLGKSLEALLYVGIGHQSLQQRF